MKTLIFIVVCLLAMSLNALHLKNDHELYFPNVWRTFIINNFRNRCNYHVFRIKFKNLCRAISP